MSLEAYICDRCGKPYSNETSLKGIMVKRWGLPPSVSSGPRWIPTVEKWCLQCVAVRDGGRYARKA